MPKIKRVPGCWEDVIAGLPNRNRRNLDDTLPTLFGQWNTPARALKGQKNQEKFEQVHLDRWKFVQAWVHPPYPGVCKW